MSKLEKLNNGFPRSSKAESQMQNMLLNSATNTVMPDGVSGEKSKYVVFDGVMKLNTQHELESVNVVTLNNGFTYVEMDISQFKKISAVKITEFNRAFAEVMINTPNALNFNNYSYTTGHIIINGNKDMTMPNGATGSDGYAGRVFMGNKKQKFVALKMKLRSETTGDGAIASYFPMVQSACNLIDIKELIKNDFSKTIYFYIDKIHEIAYITTENKTRSCYYNGKYTGNFDGCIGFTSQSKSLVRFAFDELAYACSTVDSYPLKTKFLFWRDGKAVTLDGIELDWNAMSDDEKQAAFKNGNLDNISRAEKLLVHVYNATEVKCVVDAVPKDQIVIPRGFISTEKFDSIDKAMLTSKISGKGLCKILVTIDLITYQTFDFKTQTWKIVDHSDLAEVKFSGVDVAQFSNITRRDWDKLLRGKAGFNIAFLLSIEDTIDKCEIDKLAAQVDMKGRWDK